MRRLFSRLLLCALLVLPPFAHADWASDRDGSAGYVTVTTLASVVDEAIPFVYVKGSDLPPEFWAALDAASDTDWHTVRVSNSDGTTQLACLPVGVNTSTDTGALFFLGTGMSASVDVDYRIYVGNAALSMPSASGGMGEQAVFAAYAAVYMPGVDTRNFASASFSPLVAVNSPGTAASGMEGVTAATYTSASSMYHHYNGTQSVTNWPMTLEAFAYTTVTNQRDVICGLYNSGSGTTANLAILDFGGTTAGDPIRAVFDGNSGSTSLAVTGTGFSANTWHYVTASRDANSGTSIAYIDGGSSGTDTTTVAAPNFNSFSIGGATYIGGGNNLDGNVAITLLSSSVRSANFIATQYDNLNGDLYSTGTWTALDSCNSGSTGWVLLQTAGQTATSDVDWSTTTNALVDDANAATVVIDEDTAMYSETLKLTNPNYGTTIPEGATYTVSARIKRSGTGGGGRRARDYVVKFIDDTGSLVGDNVASAATWPSTAASTDYTFTGLTLDGTEFTSAAGVALQVSGQDQTDPETASVYVVWIKVDWDCGDDAAAKSRGFFALTE